MKSRLIDLCEKGASAANHDISFGHARHTKGISIYFTRLIVVLGPRPIRNLAESVLQFSAPVAKLGASGSLIEDTVAGTTLEFDEDEMS